MATLLQDIPPADAGGAVPDPAVPTPIRRDEADLVARTVANSYRNGKQAKRLRDLTAEKYLVHTDGEGDGQWMDIVHGTRLAPSPNLDGGPRAQTNLLRPIVENFVAYHTAIPYRVVAKPASDRQSRDKARLDTIYANHILETQSINELMAEALFVACVYGHCPIHATWREDLTREAFQPVLNEGEAAVPFAGGYVDFTVGDPWATVYSPNATRRSVPWMAYERTLPLTLVQQAFQNNAIGTDVGMLRGRRDLASASRFQRIVRRWMQLAGVHGTSAIASGKPGTEEDEAISLIYRECLPGMDPQWPLGRLQVVALSNVAEADEGRVGQPVLLYDDTLPAGRFNSVRVYALGRWDDVLGKPFVADLDDLQVRRNNLETMLLAGGIRAAKPMLYGPPGSFEDDTASYEEDAVLEAAGGLAPGYVTYPTQWMKDIQGHIEAIDQQMFRQGAWQSGSRGETQPGQPAALMVASARADDSILGTSNRGVQATIVELLQLSHALTKEFAGPIPIPVKVAGSEYGHLSSSYVYAEQLSDEPPRFTVVSGFGNTPEAYGQTLLNMNAAMGADGEPVLPTKQLRKQYPDPSIWPTETDIEEIQSRRVSAIQYGFKEAAEAFRQATGFPEEAPPQWAEQAAMEIYGGGELYSPEWEIERDDPLDLHLEGMAVLIQDPSEDPIVRALARIRRDLLYEWQAMIYAQGLPPVMAGGPEMGAGPQPAATVADPTEGGTVSSEAVNPDALRDQVSNLTQQATAGA